jgi:hypothetical protein
MTEKAKACHFHGSHLYPGTHILRIACPLCQDYQVVYACDTCTTAVRSYENPDIEHLTMPCAACNKTIPVRERWKIIGKA